MFGLQYKVWGVRSRGQCSKLYPVIYRRQESTVYVCFSVSENESLSEREMIPRKHNSEQAMSEMVIRAKTRSKSSEWKNRI